MNEPPTSEEITAFVLGDLPAERARQVRAMAREDEDLATTILMMRAVLAGEVPNPRRWAAAVLRPLPLSAAAVGLLLLIGMLHLWSRAAAAGAENKQLRMQNMLLLPDKSIVDASGPAPFVDGAGPTEGSLRSIAFLPRDKGIPANPSGRVLVSVQNAAFPCVLVWTVGSTTQEVPVSLNGVETELPSGEVRITCNPRHDSCWNQCFGVIHNGRYLGNILGTILLKPKGGDTLRLLLDQPSPPWNATMIRINGEWVIVTLEKPYVHTDLALYLAGGWDRTEALPNTALFWAKEGSTGLARELARDFVANREKTSPPYDGRFRGQMHTSMIVPSLNGEVVPSLRTLTVDELVPTLTEAFESLRKQRSPQGRTVQQEIDEASRLMRDGHEEVR